jgi:hypothetical protein
MSIKTGGYWYNYKTGTYDYRSVAPETDEAAIDYLPQGSGTSLFLLLREHMGYSISEAMIHVLTIAVGEQDPNAQPTGADGDQEAA